MQARRHLPSSILAARSAPEGRSMERLADGNEGTGDESAESKRVGTPQPDYFLQTLTRIVILSEDEPGAKRQAHRSRRTPSLQSPLTPTQGILSKKSYAIGNLFL